VNALLVYRLTPKFGSSSCRGKSELSPPISQHNGPDGDSRYLTPAPSRSNNPRRIALPPYSPVHLLPLLSSAPAFPFFRALYTHLLFQQGVELDAPHFRRARDVLPRLYRDHHRLVDVYREVGVQVLAGAGDLVYRNRIARRLAGDTCGGQWER